MANNRTPNVVVIGGGTGMPVLLLGLKNLPIHLTALVNVADDGGSTGRLRNDMLMPAPGDIRNVIAALSDAEPILLKLFQHRFSVGDGLTGHSLGNLFLAAMTSITGDFYSGIKEISHVFNVKGDILPIANENMVLHAEMIDGTVVSGESKIPRANKEIKRVYLTPESVKPLPNALAAIAEADLIVISPGSLYTSILPNLIIPEVIEAIQNAKGQVVYVCNVMTQAGETAGYTASTHVKALCDHIGEGHLDAIVVHNESIKKTVRAIYAEESAEPVIYDTEQLIEMGIQIIEGDIVEYSNGTVRHNTDKLSRLLYSLI